MRRTILAIAMALVFSAAYVTDAVAQEDEFEVTLDVVLDDVEDIDGVVMSVIEDERERAQIEGEFVRERELEARLRDEETSFENDRDDADEYDDGQFDDYDDGEEVEIVDDEAEPLEESSTDEPAIDEPGIL